MRWTLFCGQKNVGVTVAETVRVNVNVIVTANVNAKKSTQRTKNVNVNVNVIASGLMQCHVTNFCRQKKNF